MTDSYQSGSIDEWLEAHKCNSTVDNKLDFHSLVQMRMLFRIWDWVSRSKMSGGLWFAKKSFSAFKLKPEQLQMNLQ